MTYARLRYDANAMASCGRASVCEFGATPLDVHLGAWICEWLRMIVDGGLQMYVCRCSCRRAAGPLDLDTSEEQKGEGGGRCVCRTCATRQARL